MIFNQAGKQPQWSMDSRLGWASVQVTLGKYSWSSFPINFSCSDLGSLGLTCMGTLRRRSLCGSQNLFHAWLMMETEAMSPDKTSGRGQASVCTPDLGLQKQQPSLTHPNCTGWRTAAEEIFTTLDVCSLGMFPSCYCDLWAHAFPMGLRLPVDTLFLRR